MKIKMRVFEKLVGTEWVPLMVAKLRKGDTFRICEGDKFVEGEGGTTEFVATSDPYKVKDERDGGMIWTIDTDV